MAQENTQAQPSQMVAGRVGVVGLGLIGGSIARAMARGGHEVYAFDLNADIETFAAIETTGGVKRSICEPCFEIAREAGITFVGCHPMAGTQFSGYAHSRANMFEGAPMVVCPAPEVRGVECLALVDRLEGLLSPCGFDKFTVTTPERHDEVIAYTSQLAHVVSNAYVKSPTLALRQGFAAGSYRDLTRVARLNPTMWCELFLDDADNLSREISTLIDALEQYKDALEDRDAERLTELLAEGDRIKRADEGEAEV